jgi:hypothetical protein
MAANAQRAHLKSKWAKVKSGARAGAINFTAQKRGAPPLNQSGNFTITKFIANAAMAETLPAVADLSGKERCFVMRWADAEKSKLKKI